MFFDADEGAVVELNVIDPAGTSHLIGTTTIDADGAFAFEETTPPITPPYTLRASSGTAKCGVPVD